MELKSLFIDCNNQLGSGSERRGSAERCQSCRIRAGRVITIVEWFWSEESAHRHCRVPSNSFPWRSEQAINNLMSFHSGLRTRNNETR
jgi:hypothetical protein